MTLQDYLSALAGKSIAVVGYGVSNAPLTELLLAQGLDVTVCDKRTEGQLSEAAALKERGAALRLGPAYLEGLREEVIFRTPGLHPFTPQLQTAVKNGSVLTSEMEAFFAVCPCHTIAVTGSDGKTTTSTLIAALLKESGRTVFLGGNIGRPLLDKVPEMKPGDFAVLELSSFQLHSMLCRPEVAVITNISPNHLDVHPSLEDYFRAKRNILLSQQPGDRLVLNADDPCTPGFAADAKADIRYFSRTHSVRSGCFSADGLIYSARNYEVQEIMPSAGILIPGLHNVDNYMAAYAATDGWINDCAFRSVARSFPGVAHRIEFVRERSGVKFYNDSIASSPTRTIAGLRCFTQAKPILIAGGHDKHVPFDELGTEIVARVKALFLTGETAGRIRDTVVNTPGYNRLTLPIYMIDDFRDAVLSAAEHAEEGDAVILSPACSSFDKFRNFAERGNTFRSIVLSLE
ncbi:MAG: UDP-N-acetylmuramoyl-L-alanine--D-glutamate ligase [Oscillospiraceae bacterium]|jgi:UDP-N-acetylmuramoylalanine--D-glutamate ligase|nr:UDP-N-acetylmuramoyl-L-alanine--D-glutamate ligase [Oscillospiraceae bacterium]